MKSPSVEAASDASTQQVDEKSLPAWRRWWIYQRERFPIAAHGPLIAAFSFSAVSLSFMLRGQSGLPSGASAWVAFCSCFLFFLQLRIADEFKDFEEDSRFRPYRPVPRGLISLGELRVLAIATALLQLCLALLLSPKLILLLFIVWIFLAAMSFEFGARKWLKSQPLIYMLSHMLIMPLIDGYATSCDWLAHGQTMPHGLEPFLAVSFFNGIVLELGRKIRAPHDEETGVETYTVLWGRSKALIAWIVALLLTAIFAIQSARAIGFEKVIVGVLASLLVIATMISHQFHRKPQTQGAKFIEGISALWTLLMYLGLGAIPLLLRLRS